MTKIIAQTRGKISAVKEKAKEILGYPGAKLLTERERQMLWRIAFSVDPINAADKYQIDRIIEAMSARAAA